MIIKRLFKDSIIYGGGDFIGKIALFSIFPVVANALDPESFGALELILTTTTLLGSFMNCGLNNAVARFYWDPDTQRNERAKIISSGLLCLLFFALIIMLLGFVTTPFISAYLNTLGFNVSWVALLGALLLMIFVQCRRYVIDILRLQFSPYKFCFISILSNVLIAISGVIAVIYIHSGLNGYIIAQSLSALLILPIAIWLIKKDVRMNINLLISKKLVMYGYPFIFANLAYWIFGSTDRWLLAVMDTSSGTGIYSVAFKFSMIAYFVATAFGMAWSPLAVKLKADQPVRYKKIYSDVLNIFLYLMIIISGMLALLSGEIISIFMNAKYTDSILPLIILCLAVIFQSTQQITAIGIYLEKKTYLIGLLSGVAAGINFLLNIMLIPYFNVTGAAWATLITYFLLTGSYLFFSQKLHPIPISWKKLFILLVCCILIFYVAVRFQSNVFSWDTVYYKILFMLGISFSVFLLCFREKIS